MVLVQEQQVKSREAIRERRLYGIKVKRKYYWLVSSSTLSFGGGFYGDDTFSLPGCPLAHLASVM